MVRREISTENQRSLRIPYLISFDHIHTRSECLREIISSECVCVCICVHFDCKVLPSTRCERDTKVEERTVPMISIVLNLNGREWRIYSSIEHVRHKSRSCSIVCRFYNCCHRRLDLARRPENAITEWPSADVTAQRHPHKKTRPCSWIACHFSPWHTIRFRRDQLRLGKKSILHQYSHHQWQAGI